MLRKSCNFTSNNQLGKVTEHSILKCHLGTKPHAESTENNDEGKDILKQPFLTWQLLYTLGRQDLKLKDTYCISS